jgi:phage terminase small subunit
VTKRISKKEAGEIAFVEEYIANGRNAKQAYKKFHPKVTERTAEVEGSKFLRKPEVAAYLQQRELELQDKSQLTTERVLKELSRLVFIDVRKLYKEDGSLKAPHELDDDTAAALASIETEELYDNSGEERKPIGKLKKVRLFNKSEAIRDAMKHLGLFEKDQSQLGAALAQAVVRKVFVVPKKKTRADSRKRR